MSQLQRGLFRQFLRWSRRKYVLESRFRINPADFKCEDLFPPSTIIENADGFQGALYHTFRKTPMSPKAVNEAIRVLRELNDFSAQVKETHDKRNLSCNDQTLTYAKFRVGQVVQNTTTAVRAVVIGWKINFTRKSQTVLVISDFDDAKKQAQATLPIQPEYVSANELELVTDPQFMRIFHTDTDKYFVAFDEKHQRYIPHENLLYLYPRDFEGIYSPEQHGQQYPCSISDDNRAFLHEVDKVIVRESLRVQELANRFFPWNHTNETSGHGGPLDDATVNRKLITNQILEEVWYRLHCLQRHDGVPLPQSFAGSKGLPITWLVEGSNRSLDYPDLSAYHVFPRRQIWLGSEKHRHYVEFHRRHAALVHAMHSPWRDIEQIYRRLGHFVELSSHVDQLLQLRYQSRGIAYNASLFPATDVLSSPDTPSIVQRPLNVEVQQFMDATQRVHATKFQLGQVVRHKLYGYRAIVSGYDQRPLQEAARRGDLLANAGSLIPRGQEQPFYRLIVDERDEMLFREGDHEHSRLLFDHTLIPEDCLELVVSQGKNDIQLAISSPYINRYFVGWDAMNQRFRPRHQLKYAHPEQEHRFPDAYPQTTILQELEKRIAATSTPSVTQEAVATAPTTDGIVADAQLYQSLVHSILREEVLIYETIDTFLLSLKTQMNSVFGGILDREMRRLQQLPSSLGTQGPSDSVLPLSTLTSSLSSLTPPSSLDHDHSDRNSSSSNSGNGAGPLAALTMSDLLRVLRLSPRRFAALDVEMWLFKVAATTSPSHPQSHNLQSLIILSASHAVRGNYKEAIRAMALAESIDPLFFEAYYKQALGWSQLADNHAVIKLCHQTLTMCPDHLGSFYLLAHAYANTSKYPPRCLCPRCWIGD